MNRRWVLVLAVCVIVIIVVCDAKTGKRKSKSRKQINQEKKRTATVRRATEPGMGRRPASRRENKTVLISKKVRKYVDMAKLAVLIDPAQAPPQAVAA